MNIVSQKYTKARKEHTCSWCKRKIKVNEMYTVFVMADKIIVRLNECKICKVVSEVRKLDKLAIMDGIQNGHAN